MGGNKVLAMFTQKESFEEMIRHEQKLNILQGIKPKQEFFSGYVQYSDVRNNSSVGAGGWYLA